LGGQVTAEKFSNQLDFTNPQKQIQEYASKFVMWAGWKFSIAALTTAQAG